MAPAPIIKAPAQGATARGVVSVSIYDDRPYGDKRERRYRVVIADNNLVSTVHILSPIVVDASDDGTNIADKLLAWLAEREFRSGKAAAYQDQADYDRRALGRAMLLDRIVEFRKFLPLFLAMEIRGGSTPAERAAYLGIALPVYRQIATRFRDVEGILPALNDIRADAWDELPGGFK